MSIQALIPPGFPNLTRYFGTLALDEAHCIRNQKSGTSISTHWLRASFNLLLTGAPFFNGITDSRGYALEATDLIIHRGFDPNLAGFRFRKLPAMVMIWYRKRVNHGNVLRQRLLFNGHSTVRSADST